MQPESEKKGKDNSELTHIKPVSNDIISSINQNNKIVTNPINNEQNQIPPVIFNPSVINPINEGIKS